MRGRLGILGRQVGRGMVVGLLALALVGCDMVPAALGLSETPGPAQAPTPVPLAYSGTITAVGSSVLAPVLSQAAARFRASFPEAHILIITATSQSGLAAVEEGGADLGLADAPEAMFGGMSATPLYDHAVAGAVYAIITHPGVGLTNLTRAQVRDLYNGTAQNWHGLGGPDLPVVVVSRPKGAGPRALFRQTVLGGMTENDGVAMPRETNSEAAALVAAQTGAIGYVSLSALGPGVQVLTLDGVAPTAAEARLGHYLFWGTEHIYTKEPAGGLAGAFINYLLTPDVQVELFKAQGFILAADLPAQSYP